MHVKFSRHPNHHRIRPSNLTWKQNQHINVKYDLRYAESSIGSVSESESRRREVAEVEAEPDISKFGGGLRRSMRRMSEAADGGLRRKWRRRGERGREEIMECDEGKIGNLVELSVLVAINGKYSSEGKSRAKGKVVIFNYDELTIQKKYDKLIWKDRSAPVTAGWISTGKFIFFYLLKTKYCGQTILQVYNLITS